LLEEHLPATKIIANCLASIPKPSIAQFLEVLETKGEFNVSGAKLDAKSYFYKPEKHVNSNI
jgi:hypothetical protein